MVNASPFELALLALINEERAAVGLDALRLNTILNDAAETHSQWMLETDQFSHEGENGSTPGQRMEDAGFPFEGQSMSAENIAWQSLRGEEGIDDDVAQVHESLMNSPGHRANILSPDAEDIGIGVEVGTFSGNSGDFDAVMVTQVFAATEADVSAFLDPGTSALEEEPLVEDDEPIVMEDIPDETTDEAEQPVAEGTPIEEPEVTDPTVVEETPEDTPDESDPTLVAEETQEPQDQTPEDDDPVMIDCPIEEDVAMDSETPIDGETPITDPVTTASPEATLPFALAEVTVDLSEAFEFRQEGDQLIWETSEEALYDAFMSSFETWIAELEQTNAMVDTDQPEDILADLMLDDQTDNVVCMMDNESEAMDDLLFSDCA